MNNFKIYMNKFKINNNKHKFQKKKSFKIYKIRFFK